MQSKRDERGHQRNSEVITLRCIHGPQHEANSMMKQHYFCWDLSRYLGAIMGLAEVGPDFATLLTATRVMAAVAARLHANLVR